MPRYKHSHTMELPSETVHQQFDEETLSHQPQNEVDSHNNTTTPQTTHPQQQQANDDSTIQHDQPHVDTDRADDDIDNLYPYINLFYDHPIPNLPHSLLNWDAYLPIPEYHYIRTDILQRTKRLEMRISHLFTVPTNQLTPIDSDVLNSMWDVSLIRTSEFSDDDFKQISSVYNQLKPLIKNVKSKFGFSRKILKNMQNATLNCKNN